MIKTWDVISDKGVLNAAFLSKTDTNTQTVAGPVTINGAISALSYSSTGNILLSAPAATDSPYIIFERGTIGDDYYDYRMNVAAGMFKLQVQDGSDWWDVFTVNRSQIDAHHIDAWSGINSHEHLILDNSLYVQGLTTTEDPINLVGMASDNCIRLGNTSYPLRIGSSDNLILNDTYQIYHEGYKPTPAAIGAATSTHVHGNITTDGKIGTVSGLAVITTAGGTLSTGTVPIASGGTGATDVAGVLTNLGIGDILRYEVVTDGLPVPPIEDHIVRWELLP